MCLLYETNERKNGLKKKKRRKEKEGRKDGREWVVQRTF
jgi:hypothetical protein